jgi:hypothetical protein
MKRITMQNENKSYYIAHTEQDDESEYTAAIDRLAKFENFYYDLEKDMKLIAEEMDRLRDDDKTHTPRFKELFVKKMINSNILMMLKYYGIE